MYACEHVCVCVCVCEWVCALFTQRHANKGVFVCVCVCISESMLFAFGIELGLTNNAFILTCMFEIWSNPSNVPTKTKNTPSLPSRSFRISMVSMVLLFSHALFTFLTLLRPFFHPLLYFSLRVPLVIEEWKRSITVTSRWTLLPASLLQSTGTDLSPWKQTANKTAEFLFCQSVPLYPLTHARTRTHARAHKHEGTHAGGHIHTHANTRTQT